MTDDAKHSETKRMSLSAKFRTLWPLIWAGLFMLTGILILVYLGRDTARLMNGPLGDFELKPLLRAETAPSMQTLADRIAVFHFWGPWSENSRRQFPEFASLVQRLKPLNDIEIVCVSCSPGMESDLEKLRRETDDFSSGLGWDGPIYCDPVLYTRGRIARMLAAGGFKYPFTMVVDRKGIVRDFWFEDCPIDEVETLVKKLQAE
jgi:hypothetical protein